MQKIINDITPLNLRTLPASVRHSYALLLLVLGPILFVSMPRQADAHAGHDDIPEASVAAVGELDPRFYARSEQVDATLIMDPSAPNQPATLYLVNHNTNAPVAAKVSAEQLTPEVKKLSVQVGDTSGVYHLAGLGDITSTATITLEVEGADVFDVLSFDNVVQPEDTSTDQVAAETVIGAMQNAVPPYIIKALLAVNALVALLLIAVLIKFLFTRSRKAVVTGKMPVLVLLTALLCASGGNLWAHAGDTHAGEGLASVGATAATGTRHFVAVDTQLRGDIRTSTAQLMNIPESFPALGRVSIRPDREAAITAPTDGMLLAQNDLGRIPIAGDQVKQGELLLQLQMIIPAEDKVTITSEKVAAEAELNQARQESQLAAQELDRATKLGTYVSRSELDQLRTRFQIAREKEQGYRERITTLDAALKGETSGVKTLDIRAPIGGIISESHSTQGEYVNAGKALFRIINVDEVFVEADIFESDLKSVENAKRAQVYVEAYPYSSFVGELHSLSPEIDPLRRTAKALFTVDNADNKLKGGMFARVDIETSDPEPVLVVPKSAIVSQDNLKQIYTKNAPEIYDAVPVTVLRFLDEYAILAPGPVEEGDVIVTQGQYQVRMSPVVGAAD